MKVLWSLLAIVAVGQCALLGSNKCTYGPSYWCSHIHHAKECNTMQHCIDTAWKDQSMGMIGSTETCFDIISALDAVRQSSDSDLIRQMAASCIEMPIQKRALCKELMTHDEKEVYLLLKSDLSSMDIASALGLCGGSADAVSGPVVNLDKASRDYCVDCKNFFGDIQQITNDTVQEVVEKLKTKVCVRLGSFESLCNVTMEQYGALVETILVQQLNPGDWCYLIKMCTKETTANFLESLEYIKAKLEIGTVECDLCKKIAEEAQTAIKDPTLQKEIMTYLENDVCPLLPGNLSTQCKTYVTEYGPLVFSLLASELSPATVCQTLGFCNATKAEAKLTAVPLGSPVSSVRVLAPLQEDKIKALPSCAICEFVMNKLEGLINTNATEAEVTAALEDVCSLLPSSVKEECDALVDEYAPMIVKELISGVLPNAVCTALHLCVVDTPQPVKSMVPVKGEKTCMACEMVLAYARSFLNNPDNQKPIEQVLVEVCKILPASYRGVCDLMITSYFPSLINLLNQYDDPVKVCTGLTLCNGTEPTITLKNLKYQPMRELQPARPHLLGTEECSRGPTFWCATEENARRCDVVDYCVKTYDLKIAP